MLTSRKGQARVPVACTHASISNLVYVVHMAHKHTHLLRGGVQQVLAAGLCEGDMHDDHADLILLVERLVLAVQWPDVPQALGGLVTCPLLVGRQACKHACAFMYAISECPAPSACLEGSICSQHGFYVPSKARWIHTAYWKKP